MSKQLNHKIAIGLSLLLIFKFYFYTRGYFFSNFLAVSLLYQCIILLILNILIVYVYIKALNYFKQNYLIYNFLLTFLVTLLTVYTIKTFFYFINIISFKEFILKFVLINLNISYSIKIILIFFIPYIIFFLVFIFFKKKENYLKFLSILGFLFFINLIFTLSSNIYYQYSKSEIDVFEPYELNNINYSSERKVIWVIFDAFDPKYAFENKKVNMINFEDLKEKSIYFSNAMSSSDSSLTSMVSNLSGANLRGIATKKNSIMIINSNERTMHFNKENTIFGRLNKNSLSYEVYSSNLDYCSLLQLENCKARKYEFENFSDQWYSGINLTYPILSQLRLLFSIINKKKIETKKKLERNFSFDKLDLDNYKDQLKTIKDFDGVGIVDTDIFKRFLNSNNSLLFVHLYLPHTPADYIKNKLSLTTNNITEDYYLNLVYADYILSRILNDIKNHENLMLVLNSDHWYNSGAEIDKKPRPVLQIFKIMGDKDQEKIDKKIFTYQTQEVIHKFLKKEINKTEDILEFYQVDTK